MTIQEDDTTVEGLNPLQRVDQLYEELVAHYGDAEDRNIRAAAKLLLVALEKFQLHAGPDWVKLVNEYLCLVADNPQKARRVMNCQRISADRNPSSMDE